MLAIRLPATMEKRLDRLAKRTGRTKTYYAREAILQHLDDLENIYLAEERMEAIKSGRVKKILLAEVMRQYELEDRAPREFTITRRRCSPGVPTALLASSLRPLRFR
jgi:RHH-type rel operon transcriptional repressor/antitoxin RelB